MIRLRGAEIADLDALLAIDRECFRRGIAYSRAELRYYLSLPRSFSLVGEDEKPKQILGFAIAETYLEKGLPIGHIVTIDVRVSARRQGLGRTLMDSLLAHLAAAGAKEVRLEVAVENTLAQAFYREFGFSQTGRIRGYYMGKLDALVMEKKFDPHVSGQPR